MSTPRRLVPALILLVAAALPLAAPASGLDSWTRVGSAGLGDSSRTEVTALAVHGGYVWVASGRVDGRLQRARLTADTAWLDVTPPWSAPERIEDLESFDGALWVATSGGRLWRQRLGGPWIDATPWTGSAPLHALASWQLAADAATLCAARGSLEVWCGLESGAPLRLPRPPLRDPRQVGSAQLHAFRDRIALAVGGSTAESRTCEVLLYRKGWTTVSDDCFGDETRTWPGGMSVFREHLYMGTGGHFTNAIVRVTAAGAWSEVTPDFYSFDGFGARPARFASTAVAAGQLFVGVHMLDALPGFSEVLRTPDGDAWSHSAAPSFGPGLTNDSAFTLTAHRMLLYAGAHNHVAGFEVWRRNFLVAEMIDESAGLFRDLTVDGRRQIVCLRLPVPRSCPGRPVLFERFAAVKLGFDAARHPKDDASLLQAARLRLAAAEKELLAGIALADQAEKLAAHDPAKARTLRLQAAQRLAAALETTSEVWDTAAAALGGKG
jgi:hypothetical protein